MLLLSGISHNTLLVQAKLHLVASRYNVMYDTMVNEAIGGSSIAIEHGLTTQSEAMAYAEALRLAAANEGIMITTSVNPTHIRCFFPQEAAWNVSFAIVDANRISGANVDPNAYDRDTQHHQRRRAPASLVGARPCPCQTAAKKRSKQKNAWNAAMKSVQSLWRFRTLLEVLITAVMVR